MQRKPPQHQQEQRQPHIRQQSCFVEVHRQLAATHSVIITEQHPLEVVAAHRHVGEEGGHCGPADQQCIIFRDIAAF